MKTWEQLKANFDTFVELENDAIKTLESQYGFQGIPPIESRLNFVEWRLRQSTNLLVQMYHYLSALQQKDSTCQK